MKAKAPLLVILVLAGAAVILGFIVVAMKPPAARERESDAAAAASFPRRADANAMKSEPAALPDPNAPLPKNGAKMAQSLSLIKTPPAAAPQKTRTACVENVEGGYDEPDTLEALLACQETLRHGRPVPEAFAERQRTEVRDYLTRHPERASTDEPPSTQAEERR